MSGEDYTSLLSDIKDYLNITWNDARTDRNLAGMIKRGVSRLQEIAGVDSLNFMEEGLPRQLLFDYCRYANSQALEAFEINFQSYLLDLHFSYQAKLMAQEDTDENQST